MLEHIYVVVGSGNSDIGKGWLTAAISSVLPRALPVKIDPFLNTAFPADIGIPLNGKIVSDDLATYQRLGLPIFPECNIVNGALLLEMLQQPVKTFVRRNKPVIKKLTFADISELLANKLLGLTNLIEDCRNLLIEVGGIVTDQENIWIPNALKLLGAKSGVLPEIVVLSYIEHSEVGFPVKTQNVRFAIRQAQGHYRLPIKACFVRRRHVPSDVTAEQIREELQNIAYETQLDPYRIIFEDNFADVFELRDFVDSCGIFKCQPQSLMVSSCLLDIPCRHDGTSNALDQKVLNNLRSCEVVAICPELLAGFDIPRIPCEIVGGDGEDVLTGKARILTQDGQDLTERFKLGAQKAVEMALRIRPSRLILCDKSPSCGVLHIYDGTFSHQVIEGVGIFTALLKRYQFQYISNTQL
jgi:uncharacterized protein YbbK (DUF523 family)